MLSLRTVRAEQRVSRLAVGTDAPGGPCMSRHTPTERIGIFAVCTNLPILFSCLSPMPPGGDKPPPLRQRRGCGANIYGDARIRPGAAGILRRFQLLRMTPLPVPDCGQPGTTSPDGEAKASHSRRDGRTLGGPIRLPGHRKVGKRREANEQKSGRPMVGPTGARPGHVRT